MKAMQRVAIVMVAALAGCGGSEQLPGSELMGRFRLATEIPRGPWVDRVDGVVDPASGADCVSVPAPRPADKDCGPNGIDPDGIDEEGGDGDEECSTIQRIEKFPEVILELPEFLAILSRNAGSEAFVTVDGRSRDASWDGQVLTSTVELERTFSNCECTTTQTKVVETLTLTLLSGSQFEALGGQCPTGALPTGPGIVPPSTTAAGFDAVYACGTLVDTIVAGDDCTCSSCAITYPTIGSRE